MVSSRIPALFDIPLTRDNEDDILYAARQAGWVQHATGSFSTVLVRGDEALKIFDDPAYLDFLTQIVSPANRLFPIVIAGPYVGSGLSAVILERLDVLTKEAMPISDDIMTVFEMADNRGQLEFGCIYVLALEEKIGSEGIDAIDLIIGLAEAFGLSTDVRPENLMIRPTTGEIIFTDPLKI